MNVISRGARNAFRNKVRTLSIVLILGLSIGLALAMLVARASVEDKIQSVKSSIGNTITISPAGARGFEGGGEPLTSEQLKSVSSVQHVKSVTQTLNDRLTTQNTNLVSSIDAGSIGNRQANNNGVGFQAPPPNEMRGSAQNSGGLSTGSAQITRTFTLPVMLIGTDTVTSTTYGGSTVSITSGQAIDPTKDEDKAVIGKALAAKNNLQVGSTFQAYGKTVAVVGIYDAGNNFANSGIVMPLLAVQRLSGQTGSVTSATATIDSIDNVTAATKEIESVLGGKADVVNNQDTATQAVEPLESVKTIATFSLIGAVVAGAVIILLTMIMVVRERRREIGVYKAIGASNTKIMLQFVTEAVTLTLLATVAGIIIGVAAASPVTNVLVNNSTSAAQQQQAGPNAPQGVSSATRRSGGPGGGMLITRNASTNIRNVQASVGTEILLYGFGAAMIIAIIGSALPAYLISKVRPAEVMRAE